MHVLTLSQFILSHSSNMWILERCAGLMKPYGIILTQEVGWHLDGRTFSISHIYIFPKLSTEEKFHGKVASKLQKEGQN